MTANQTLDCHARVHTDTRGEGVVVMATCAGERRDGTACTTGVPVGTLYCYHHDPARAEERSRKASRAASAKHDSVAKEMRDLRDLIWDITVRLIEGNLNSRVRFSMTRIIQLLQTYLRAAEIELAAGGKPERGSSVLPPSMLEKLQQYIPDKEDGEGTETQARHSKMMSPAGELTTGRELPEEVAEGWRRRLQAEIDRELQAQPS